VLTGVEISYKVSIQKLICVKLNGHKLANKVDFVLNEVDNTIAFTFNLAPND